MVNKKFLLSVCIISKNEEKHLSRCLNSIQNIADEIILLDSFSTDDTIEIAGQFNCKIYQHEWPNDYSLARNKCISFAKSEWILFLDADEELVNADSILKIIRRTKNDSAIKGFIIERTEIFRNFDSGRLEKQPIGIVRLFRNDKNIKFEGSIHERIHPSIIDKRYKIQAIKDSKIIHHIYHTYKEELEKKHNYYLSLIEKELLENPFDHWMLFQKAKTLWFLKGISNAAEIFKKLSVDDKCPTDLRVASLCNLSVLLAADCKFDEAISYLQESLKIIPGQGQALFLLGDIFYESGDYKKAAKYYAKVPTSMKFVNTNNFIPGGLFLYPETKYYKLACCFLALNKIFLAKFFLTLSLLHDKNYTNSLYTLATAYLVQSKKEKAVRLLKKSIELDPQWIKPKTLLEKILSGNEKK